tara:strand:- start:903 stop:1796 length:894 start_codon:yes stop_codon:yes gene_type:complete
MKIYDSFMFFDEDMLLDLRLNILNEYVDKFIITEATYLHSGKKKKLTFDINKFSKFKEKIIYNVIDSLPSNLEKIYEDDDKITKGKKLINNSNKREHFQRNGALKILEKAEPSDVVIINDLDEIPNLKNFNFKKIENKIIMFNQKVFYYKFNLLYKDLSWFGTRICKKRKLISPQWLRDVKHKNYPFWRIDTFFSKMKYFNISYVDNGGWHFTNIKSPEDIEKKYLNFLHHQDFEYSGLKIEDIKKIIKNKKVLYDLGADQRDNKWSASKILNKISLTEMPDYIIKNTNKYSDWIEN